MTPKETIPNILQFADIEAFAVQMGGEAGKGKDTQVKFLLKVVEGAYHSALDLLPNKHGTSVDDAIALAGSYVKAQQGSVIFDAKAPNQQKLISCLRTCIRLGSWPKGGQGEPLATVNNLITHRQKLRQKPAEAKKLDDAANTLLKFARAQLKRDQLIEGDELFAFCYKPQAELSTAEDILAGVRGTLNKLIAGRLSHGTAQDASDEVKEAASLLTQRLAQIASEKGSA